VLLKVQAKHEAISALVITRKDFSALGAWCNCFDREQYSFDECASHFSLCDLSEIFPIPNKNAVCAALGLCTLHTTQVTAGGMQKGQKIQVVMHILTCLPHELMMLEVIV
jgi:hypothetical protein